jgi:ribonuclease HIII
MSHVFTLTPDQMLRLKKAVAEGYELLRPPYTECVAKADHLSVSLYTSGKLVIQGKRAAEFIEFVLQPLILQDVSLSPSFDRTWRIGVDEAGKGDFFGPLVVAGVCAGEERLDALIKLGVRDSKSMSDQLVRKIAAGIRKTVRYSLIRFPPPRYNTLYKEFSNLNHLLAWGHAKAIQTLAEEDPSVELARIDQFAAPWVVEKALKKQRVSIRLEQSVRGEADPVVAAASILARDAFLEGLEACSREVGMPLPKGAGAPILEAGRSLIARESPEILKHCAKLHFKTLQAICGEEAATALRATLISNPDPNS